MARMIDADALIKAMGVHTYMQTEWTPATAWGVPIVDAETVVRCKDCCHCIHNEFFDTYHCWKFSWSTPTERDGFCLWGERRKDETDVSDMPYCSNCEVKTDDTEESSIIPKADENTIPKDLYEDKTMGRFEKICVLLSVIIGLLIAILQRM